MTLWNYIKNHMLKNPSSKIYEDSASLSYEETAIWAECFADKLQGVHCCAVLCSSEMAAAMSLLACFAAQATAVPLSMRYGEKHCNKILNSISPDAIIMDVGGEITVYKIKESQYIEPKEHPALIMCTSGTTGIPKGAMLSEKNIITNVSDIADYFVLDTNDNILISRPLYHCAVLTGEFLTALVKGSDIRFYSEQFNPAKMLELIEKYEITAFCGTPTLLSMMARFNRTSHTDTLKHICISGECMSRETGHKISQAFPNSNIYHVYGLTEACPRVSYLPPKYFSEHPDCVGIPLKSVSIKIINIAGEICKENEEGMLFVKGDNVMLGYYRDPDKTQKVLRDEWLCTGDIATINKSGFLKIKGRNDDLIIKSGMNIYPAEIEAELKKDTRVKEVLVYGINNQLGTQIGLKIVGDFKSVEEIKQLCATSLPSFQVPSIIELSDELPKNGSGKIIRR
ncbi:MAG: acyl--CoA ligase [Ruminococcaceae bacterium]|nr:acyl--CoA ligase [Oscillospiraceae bacterium]